MSLTHRILWLDDDLDSVRTYASELDSQTYAVQLISSKKDLIESLLDPWDLIIIDLQLGSGSWEGLDILADFRKANRITPVLVCTGKGAKREVKTAFELGADGIIFKEDISQELAKVVKPLVDPYARFTATLEQLPTPIAYLGRRFVEADSQLEKIRLAFDLLEVALKLIMIRCFAEFESIKQWPGRLNTQVKDKILVIPSLGDWVRCMEIVGSNDIDQECTICGTIKKAVQNQKLINRVNEAVRARNALAHGVTPSESSCQESLQTWWPIFFKLIMRCTPLHTEEMVYVESLERGRRGYLAKVLRLVGSSSLLKRDVLECENPPFTSQIGVRSYGSSNLISVHPWIRLYRSEVYGYSVGIYDKVLASSTVEGHRTPRLDDKVEYIDLFSGKKIKIGEFSEFVYSYSSFGLSPT